MNIATDLHLTLPVDSYDEAGVLNSTRKPLHQIPHCCLGSIGGFEGLVLYAYFPNIQEPDRTTTFLTDDQLSLWVDGVFLPALYAEHEGEDGLLQHFPASYAVAKANALSHGTERSSYDHEMHLSRTQLLKYFIQPEKLAGTWNRVLEGIQGPQFEIFHGVTLFGNAKDLKYRYMSSSVPTMRSKFERQYDWAINSEFQARSRVFIDLAKQVTAQG